MHARSLIKLSIVAAVCAGGLAVVAPTATAAPDPVTGATAYQNMVISAAMAHTPGGTRASASEVVWDGGRAFLIVPATAAEDPSVTSTDPSGLPDSRSQCPFGYFCGWSEPNFGGCFAGIRTGASPNYWFNWGQFSADNCGSRGTWSWFNNSNFRGWKEQHHSGGTQLSRYVWQGGTGSGDTRCVSPGRSNSNVTNSQDRVDGWMQGSTNPDNC